MPYNPFPTIDDAIMSVVNKGVRAYNWTTGGTRAELAVNLVGVGTVAEIVGSYIFDNSAVMGGIIIAAPNVVYPILYHNQERRELDSHAYDHDSEFFNYCLGYSLSSNLITIFSGFNFLSTFCSGLGFIGLSHFVMRADPVLPQKNVFRRTMESLEEKLAQLVPSEG